MKKILFCNIPMKDKTDKCKYDSDDLSVPVSDREVVYPINAFLEKTMTAEDELKLVLLVKKDPYGNYKKNAEAFLAEFSEVNQEVQAKYTYTIIDTEFSEEKAIHEQLMSRIVDELEDNSQVLADITYGPKDLPVVLFYALNFAEKFLGCDIENIIYGQANFGANSKPENTKICDMVPLFYLNTVTNTIHCDTSEKARKTLKSLLSL